MRILFIDTTTSFVNIAITENDKIIYLKQLEIRDDMSSQIMPLIARGFDEVDFSIKDIDKIMVANGPGSFTGIRIGVTIAKTIAWALKKDIIPVSSLELLATTQVKTNYVIPMIDARRGFVYAGVYDKDLNLIKADEYVDYNKLSNYFNDGTIISFDSLNGAEKPKIDLLRIIKKHQYDISSNCHNVNPNYLKKTEAEEKLNINGNN